MAIEDYIPNIFGNVPVGYEGLLGPEQSAALQKRANLAGLLGGVAALAQGMGAGGAPRSPFQNITSALAAGFGGAGQTYQQGIQNLIQQQQFGLQQRQMAGIQAMKLKYPDLADEFDTNPVGAFRIVAAREESLRRPVTLKPDEMLVSPKGDVLFRGEPKKVDKAEVINPDEATALGLPPGAVYQRKPTGEIELIAGTAPKDVKQQSRVLTTEEAAQIGLPTAGGQKYQVDANGKIDLVQGTALDKPATSIEEYNFYRSQGGKKTYEQFLKDKIPSTNISVNTGQLSKPTAGKVEEGVLADAAAIARLNNIQFSYKPEYQNIRFRTGQAWNTLRDKFGGLPESEKRQLTEYSQYKQNSLQNLNQTIKDLTGAAMGVQEADRIIASLPNAGTDIFGGDSPTEFEAKLNNAVKQTKYALARKNYALKKGLNWESLPLDSLPSLINKRGKEIAAQYKLDVKKPADLQIIDRQLAAEFGIAF